MFKIDTPCLFLILFTPIPILLRLSSNKVIISSINSYVTPVSIIFKIFFKNIFIKKIKLLNHINYNTYFNINDNFIFNLNIKFT